MVLEQSLAVAVELKAMSNEDIFAGMDAGTVHAHPEVWDPNLDALRKTYVEQRGTVREAPHAVSASQGLCTTRQTAVELDIRSAKVTTIGPQAVDAFYVRTAGGKLTDEELLAEVRRAVQHAVETAPG